MTRALPVRWASFVPRVRRRRNISRTSADHVAIPLCYNLTHNAADWPEAHDQDRRRA
jgi:hypothetical protein